MHPTEGLRVINEVEQLAAFEFAACQTSSGVRNLLFNLELRSGSSRKRSGCCAGTGRHCPAISCCRAGGAPRSASPARATSDRAGRSFTVAFGIWAGSTARRLRRRPVPRSCRPANPRLCRPAGGAYFRAVAGWYETVGIGVAGGRLFEAVDRHIATRLGVGSTRPPAASR